MENHPCARKLTENPFFKQENKFASLCNCVVRSGFPLGLENLEKWEGIFQSGNFEQTGKVREKSGKTTQNTGKLR